MKFLRLTLSRKGGGPLWINFDHVTGFSHNPETGGTDVEFQQSAGMNEVFVNVSETEEAIAEALGDDCKLVGEVNR